jgi:hypothetical protein
MNNSERATSSGFSTAGFIVHSDEKIGQHQAFLNVEN